MISVNLYFTLFVLIGSYMQLSVIYAKVVIVVSGPKCRKSQEPQDPSLLRHCVVYESWLRCIVKDEKGLVPTWCCSPLHHMPLCMYNHDKIGCNKHAVKPM